MTNNITTKDLQALEEMMVLENWIATKFLFLSEMLEDKLSKNFLAFGKEHLKNHEKLLRFLERGGESK